MANLMISYTERRPFINREERVRAALAGKEVDRVPVAAWMRLSAFDQDPISLAEAEVDLTEKLEPRTLNPEPHLKTAARNHSDSGFFYS